MSSLCLGREIILLVRVLFSNFILPFLRGGDGIGAKMIMWLVNQVYAPLIFVNLLCLVSVNIWLGINDTGEVGYRAGRATM
ncbi:hypothetical protein ACFLTP_10350 [Chloroflexota bacterium]